MSTFRVRKYFSVIDGPGVVELRSPVLVSVRRGEAKGVSRGHLLSCCRSLYVHAATYFDF